MLTILATSDTVFLLLKGIVFFWNVMSKVVLGRCGVVGLLLVSGMTLTKNVFIVLNFNFLTFHKKIVLLVS